MNLRIERRFDQLVSDFERKDAAIRLPRKAAGNGGGWGDGKGGGGSHSGGEGVMSEWEEAAREMVMAMVCKELCLLLKVKSPCFEPSGVHIQGESVLIDLNIHQEPVQKARPPPSLLAFSGVKVQTLTDLCTRATRAPSLLQPSPSGSV
jgi:hypothetical protein